MTRVAMVHLLYKRPSERSAWRLRTSGTHIPNDIRNVSLLSSFRAKLQ